ncbi:MAG: phage portal protein [Candidatus Nanopelagicaceae bacterium]
MGAIRDFLFPSVQAAKPAMVTDVQAANLQPLQNLDYFSVLGTPVSITRQLAMSVPSVARARNIICGTIGSLPLTTFNRITGDYVDPHRVINQPDPRVAGFVIYNWLAEDIWMYGAGYGQVLEMYSATDGGRVRAWTRIRPSRVTVDTDIQTDSITGYKVDGKPVPISGVGSIIRFDGPDEGLLHRAGKTIQAAVYLENAAVNYAKEPAPTMVLKSNGTNLTAERISSLLSAWKTARQSRSTAFLNADVDLKEFGFDPKTMQLTEGRQYVALELSRACGIPAYFLSAEQTSMTYSNAVNERRSLVDFSLRPILKAIEERLSLPDFVPNPVMVRFDLDDFLRGNPLERAQVYEILNRIGAMSVEQIQREEDLIPNEG